MVGSAAFLGPGVLGVFGIGALLFLAPALWLRSRNRILSNMLLVGAGVVAALPALCFLALFLHRNDPP